MAQKDLFKKFRPNVGVMLFNQQAQVWYGRRVGDFADLGAPRDRYRWQMPQGGVDADEDIATAAFRELKEETGVVSARLLTVTPGWSIVNRTNVLLLCLGALVSVRTRQNIQSALSAPEVHTFCPLITYSSPSTTARV